MSENKFTKIDGIIVVGDVDDYYLEKLQMYTNCPYVYSSNRSGNASNGIYVGTSVVESGLTIGYLNYGTLDIVSGGITLRILATANTSYDDMLNEAAKRFAPTLVSKYLGKNLPDPPKARGGGGCRKVMCLY